jgi:hypothetical protein
MPGLFQSSHDLFRVRCLRGATGICLNPTETEILAMEFDAVLSVPRRVGFSTLYRLARSKSGAKIAGSCQSENASEVACRLLNVVLHQKKNAHRVVQRSDRCDSKGAHVSHAPLPLKIFNGTQPGSTIGGRHVLAETGILERCFHFTPVLSVRKAQKIRRALSDIRQTKLYKRIILACNKLCPMLVVEFRGRPMANILRQASCRSVSKRLPRLPMERDFQSSQLLLTESR